MAEAARRHRRRLRQKSEGQGYQTLTLIFCFDIRSELLRRNRLWKNRCSSNVHLVDHTCGEQIAHRRFFIIKSSARVYGRYLFCQRFPMKTTEKPCNYAGWSVVFNFSCSMLQPRITPNKSLQIANNANMLRHHRKKGGEYSPVVRSLRLGSATLI